MTKKNSSRFAIEGSTARNRMSSIPPRFERKISSGTFAIGNFNETVYQKRLWDILEKNDQLAKLLSQSSRQPNHIGRYLLKEIDEYDTLPLHIKEMIETNVIIFIREQTRAVSGSDQKKFQLPSKEDIRKKIFKEAVRVTGMLEADPKIPAKVLEELNAWFHHTALFEYNIFTSLPNSIKKIITRELINFMQRSEDPNDETIETQIIELACDAVAYAEGHGKLDKFDKIDLLTWKEYVLRSPASISFIQRQQFSNIDLILRKE